MKFIIQPISALTRTATALCMSAGIAFTASNAGVINADGYALIAADAHTNAILDTDTNLLWLDATETVNRSVGDISSKLGSGNEFDGWELASRAQIEKLFLDAGLIQTSPGSGWVANAPQQTAVQAFAAIYGQTATTGNIRGVNLWHADTFTNTGVQGGMTAAWIPIDTRYWVGTNGTSPDYVNSGPDGWGTALVRSAGDPDNVPAPAALGFLGFGLAGLGMARRRRSIK